MGIKNILQWVCLVAVPLQSWQLLVTKSNLWTSFMIKFLCHCNIFSLFAYKFHVSLVNTYYVHMSVINSFRRNSTKATFGICNSIMYSFSTHILGHCHLKVVATMLFYLMHFLIYQLVYFYGQYKKNMLAL